jgi:hypothetical protein
MFVLILLVCALSAWTGAKMRQASAERQVVSWLKANGASVEYGLFGTVVGVDFCGSTTAHLSPLTSLVDLKSLSVHADQYKAFLKVRDNLPKCEVMICVNATGLAS